MGQAGRKTPGHTADTTDATIESIKILFQKETDNRIGLTTTFRQMIEFSWSGQTQGAKSRLPMSVRNLTEAS